MKAAFSMILMVVALVGTMSMEMENTGMMPEVVVTAPRFEGEDIAYAGMMPEIVVEASRYIAEEEPGILPEILVIAPRYNRSGLEVTFSHITSSPSWVLN